MAEKLLKYYKYCFETAGFKGKIELAQATKLPSNQAAIEPDSPENLALFQQVIERITGKPAPTF